MWSLFRVWSIWSVMGCACAVLAQRLDQDAILMPRASRVRDREMTKNDEPTCEQLKAMWRFSKRQARAPEIMNEVSSYRDPFMYNEWPINTNTPRVAPRFRYQYPVAARETYGRVINKAPPNAPPRTPDYDEVFGVLNVPNTSGKVLRYPGPSRSHGLPTYRVPPQRDSFEILKNIIRKEHIRELQRKYEADQKLDLKGLTSGRSEDYAYDPYAEQEPRGMQNLQMEYPADESTSRHSKKPPAGSRQVSQFSRYSDVMIPPARRAFYHQYFDLAPEFNPYY